RVEDRVRRLALPGLPDPAVDPAAGVRVDQDVVPRDRIGVPAEHLGIELGRLFRLGPVDLEPRDRAAHGSSFSSVPPDAIAPGAYPTDDRPGPLSTGGAKGSQAGRAWTIGWRRSRPGASRRGRTRARSPPRRRRSRWRPRTRPPPGP